MGAMLLLKQKLLLLLFLLVHCVANGQDKRLLIGSFSESGKMGFVNMIGDTILSPQFDEAEFAYYDSTFYYIVRKENSYGVISQWGEIIIPIIYHRIIPSHGERFIVQIIDDEKSEYGYRVVSNENKWLTDVYDDIYHDGNNDCCIVLRGELQGVLNDSYEEILLGNYKVIEAKTIWENNCYSGFQFSYYEVTSEEGKGIVDSKGQILLAPIYKEIIPRLRNPQCDVQEVVFEASKADLKWGVLDAHGTTLVPFIYEDIEVVFPNVNRRDCYYDFNRDCAEEVRSLCFVKEDENMVVYNLATQTKSKPYDELSSFGEFVLFRSDSTFGVLNTEFDVVYETDVYEITPYQDRWALDFPSAILYLPLFEDQLGQDCPSPYPDKSVLQPCDQVLYYRTPKSKYVGLLNIENNRSIANVYDSILIRRLPATRVYWAFRSQEEGKETHLDIYNEEMKCIRQLTIRSNQPDLISEHSYQGSESSMLNVIHGLDGRIGALNYLGDTLIPFQFSDFRYGRERAHDTIPSLCYFFKEGNWGLFNTKGEALIPCEFSSIKMNSYPFNYFWCERSKGSFEIYDNNFKVIATNCQAHFARNKPNRFGHYEQITSRGYSPTELKQRTLFVIKNGRLYFYEDETWKLMDASVIPIQRESITLFKECTIDKKGNVLNMEDFELGFYLKVRR